MADDRFGNPGGVVDEDENFYEDEEYNQYPPDQYEEPPAEFEPTGNRRDRPYMFNVVPYPCICEENEQSISIEEIGAVFDNLKKFFGFQDDSKMNMLDHFLVQLDSRASRLTAYEALITLHADYIAGENSNYKKWYFGALLKTDGMRDLSIKPPAEMTEDEKSRFYKFRVSLRGNTPEEAMINSSNKFSEDFLKRELDSNSFEGIEHRWKVVNNMLTPTEMVEQVGLYLLIWGEANQIRFTPEAICFIYKIAYDHYCHNRNNEDYIEPAEGSFLDVVITPLYRFIKFQNYKPYEGKIIKRDRDHRGVIGYDDVNQLFWYKKGLERLRLKDKKKLIDLPKGERYSRINEVSWDKVFYKTYKERRTWMHLFTNFNRIWIIHLAIFWYYTSFNSPTLYTPNYIQTLNNRPLHQVTFSIVSLAGSISCIIQFIATFCELFFIPRSWPGAQPVFGRLVFSIMLFIINFSPSIYVLGFIPIDTYSRSAYYVSIVQFIISIFTVLFLVLIPPGALLGSYLNSPKYYASKAFTANFPTLKTPNRLSSTMLWFAIFVCKFTESYFFLTLSIRDPIRVLATMKMTRCVGDRYLGNIICRYQPMVVLFLMYLVDLILFFLDTYLWYIICNCIFSCFSSYKAGFSVLSPWKNQYGNLHKRIYTKILATKDMEVKYKPKVLVAQVWNAIIISMYKEHILNLNQVEKLLYRQVRSEVEGKNALRDPSFFVTQGDASTDVGNFYFPKKSQAERRLSFFARALASNMPEAIPVECLPTFCVLVPHYSEKIILSLKEIIRENEANSKLSLLEYLKVLFPDEWSCFVSDTKIMAGNRLQEELEKDNKDYHYNHVSTEEESLKDPYWSKILDSPFIFVGFKSEIPEFTLRTRIWASLKTQTLYRTVSGFMNYYKALKTLYRIENPELIGQMDVESQEKEIEHMAGRKFKMIVSMQRYQYFNSEELEATEFLLGSHKHLRIAYIEKQKKEDVSEDLGEDAYNYYSCMFDGKSEKDEAGRRVPYYKIRLSGNPILGDGKADNQNHSIIFYRGEYIQVIDANQDNYLEECMKIRSVLSEFEEFEGMNVNPYVPGLDTPRRSPVAIVGAREYIFSESAGVLGDVAAGKEQTFGTLFSRTLSIIGGKLHYGHPDFLNGIFMTTRGGISKAQKGLHLNEDIYAGMTALCRGGRIKHCDYYQCGKGRDLGFGSILNFTTKIGAGMGEQLLSREYYYLGTQLPLDTFLSFFYAHAGFHINNLLIILSVNLFMCVVLNLGSLNSETITCHYNKDVPITDLQIPLGCANVEPVLDWVSRFVLSIFICFFMAFLPLYLQEFTERGILKAASRIICHVTCFSPLFEIFVCQIYSTSLTANLTFGGAKYIATGRGFATARQPFSEQYAKFATNSIYYGAYMFLTLLFGTVTMWKPALLWFWISTISLCLAPFVFNPHQFDIMDFFIDYREYIRWLTRGNTKYHPRSWITYIRESRSRFTGYRKGKFLVSYKNTQKPSFSNLFFSEVLGSLFYAGCSFFAYTFINAQNGVKDAKPVNSVLRLGFVVLFPILFNAVIMVFTIPLAFTFGITFRCCCTKTASIVASFAHGLSVVVYVVTWELLWFLEGWNFSRALAGVICAISIQNIIFQMITIMFLTREDTHLDVNKAWWDGSWIEAEADSYKIILFVREYLVKIVELSIFALDFVLGHCLLFVQTPVLFIPYINNMHSYMLFWFKLQNTMLAPAVSKKQKKRRRRIVFRYSFLYFFIMLSFVAIISIPKLTISYIPTVDEYLPPYLQGITQPNHQKNNDTGPNAPSTVLRNTPSIGLLKTMF